jgi:hypothetical protein
VVRRLLLLLALVLGLAACGGSGASKDNVKIAFGLSGGTMMPYSVTIAPGGAVTSTGNSPVTPKPVASVREKYLSLLVRGRLWNLKSEQCKGTLPDESSMFVTALGRTVTVRGTCESSFTQMWHDLASAVGLNS